MKIKTHVTILISSLLIYLSIHYIGVLIYSKDSLVFQIMIWVTTILVDMIICSYLVYFSSIKRGHAYRFWMLLTFGSILYFIGDIIVAYQRLILHDSAIFVDPSDFFYLLCLIIFVAAFLYELLYDRNIWEQLFIICDVCIVVTAQFTLSYYLLIEQAIHIIATTYLNIIVQLMYPMANLLFLLIGISLLFRPLSLLSKQVSIFLATSVIGYASIDSIYAYLKYFTAEHSGFIIAPLYQFFLMLIVIACVLHTKEAEHTEQVLLTPQIGEAIHLSLPYLSVIALSTFVLIERAFSPILVIGLIVTFFFVLIRHILVRRQNKELLLTQMRFNQHLEEQIELRTQDLVQQKDALYRSKKMFESLYEHHPDPIFTLDLHGNFLNVNHAGITLLGYQTNELLNQPYYSLVYEKDLKKIIDAFHHVKRGNSISLEIRAYHKNRDIYFLHVTAVPIILKEHIPGVYLMIKDITESKQQQEQINFLAYHDTLTELSNRRSFHKQLEEAIVRAKITKQPFAVLFLDLDRFKIINDTLGHRIGDLLLIAIAKRLKQISNPNVKLARLAGDEFTLLIENIKHTAEVQTVADHILAALNEPFQIENHHLQISSSIGIAIYPEAGEDPMSILQHADMAMYETKNKGKNGSSIYTQELYEKMERKSRIEKDFPLALANNQFFISYQPQVDIRTKKIVGAEALIRWNHPILGNISPCEFIPIVEETPQIIPLGHWMLKESCKQLKYWHKLGYADLKISVNLSAKEFQQDNLIENILTILKEVQVEPRFLILELTERIAMINEKETLLKLKKLKEHGIQTSIDDFGTGYSSLAYLSLFPIDALKVPREFTQLADQREEERAIISTILSLANTLNLSVVAEGIETEKQFDFLQANNCRYMQGYYFSKPLTSKQFLNFLQKPPF
ncbi:putative bifunctional diguanylate cyclase/phosphodiesterase [Bacillus cytotoxicus]|uniref:putative bifunctional diguanylate cyclase/phosphodiesterase n=1 Tax=Bacillus cytotoxicus TaxID=580165 RepID=UPI0008646B40|nr:EAL domain-containing protein [Bacillus cytotoxicus]AWC30585.1 diguanylate cyclase [Bacillus cytotoxicus]AWC42727.1 diguanylate cyclase [Bacillus cytotoxicus]AWC50658.1 diguanylate cyclase [Bacillus cytotoxicus]AWC54713.1 diguanylate cyclase [Bacillus cytotoxicus]AWC58835.1 diguanylate cyclase [Bacillus cytotoxicus]